MGQGWGRWQPLPPWPGAGGSASSSDGSEESGRWMPGTAEAGAGVPNEKVYNAAI